MAQQSLNTGKSLPCVVPQTSKVFKGAHFSPFVRAYAPDLGAHDIDQETFLGFIDGLNEVFIGHPIFEATNIVGAVMGIFGVIHPVQWTGAALSLGSVAASKATTFAATRAYLKAINADVFNPVGLKVEIMTTKKMMEKVGCVGDSLALPPLETFEDLLAGKTESVSQDDSQSDQRPLDEPMMRRITALEGYAMKLDFDVPASVSPESLLRRMGSAHARRLSRKQQEKLVKNREKAVRKYNENLEKADKEKLEREQKIAALQGELAKLNQSDDNEASKSARKRERRTEDLAHKIEKEEGKLEEKTTKYHEEGQKVLLKPGEKEEKIAQKIRWIVISEWEGEAEEDAKSVDASSDVI